MPKGSKPGERRGGRQRGTPNKKTLLRNAEIKAISGKPDLTPLDYFLGVMRNQHFPVTTRVQAALKALPRLHAKRRAMMWMSLSLRRKRLLRILSMRSGVPVLARASPQVSASGPKCACRVAAICSQ
jgi:hypothetical protein